MLPGGRSLCTVRNLIARTYFPKPAFIHYGMPTRIANTPKVHDQQPPIFEEGSSLDGGATRLFAHAETELLNEAPSRLVEFLNNKFGHTATARRHPAMPNTDSISAYLAIRDTPSSLPSLCAEAYARISKQAEAEGLQQVMALLAEDLLTHFPQSDTRGFSESILAILSHATSECPLSDQCILQLYEAFVSSNAAIPLLTPDIVRRIAVAALMSPNAPIPPLETLSPALLSSYPQTQEDRIKSTQLGYELLMKVMAEGEESYPRALRLFQELIDANRIPKDAQARAGERGGSFQVLVTSALVRACLWFEWREKASEILMEILQNPQWFRAKGVTERDVQVIIELTLELLRILLPSTSNNDVQISQRLIVALLASSEPHSPPLEIPHDILFAFYDSCYDCQLIVPAAHMYHHLQSPQIRQYHGYPPPRHAALLWLLDHFASPGVSWEETKRGDLEGRLYLARSMVGDILHLKHPVQAMDRARLVALAAARGFGMYARQLWEMYADENNPDRDIVRGNAHMLVPLVKLFARAQKRWDVINKDKSVPRAVEESQDGVTSLGASPLPRDYLQFAQRVLASFIETKVPLDTATHYDLNALARAHLYLGHLAEAIKILTVLIDRGDTPQVMDINVLLAGIAPYSPGRAAWMIEHMLKQGVLPSASTFATVLHAALQDKNVKLVRKLITRAHQLGYGSLTHKGLASLVRAATTFEYTSDKKKRIQQQINVRWAMGAVETIMQHRTKTRNSSDHIKDHAISVSVGMNCVRGSLKAVEPELGFRFWKLLVKDRVLWDDREHKDLRAWIARLIRHEWRAWRLGTDIAEGILEEMRAPGVKADGPRVARERPYDNSGSVDVGNHGGAGVRIMWEGPK